MARRFVLIPLLVIASARSVDAQDVPGDNAEEFCSLTNVDLMSSLDGAWSIQQSAGSALAIGFPIPIPLPPHGAESIVFKYNPEGRYMDVRSADMSDEMVMFVPVDEQKERTLELLGEEAEKKAKESGSVCDWDALPALVGTNVYVALSEEAWDYYTITAPYCEEVKHDAGLEWCKKVTANAPGPLKMEMTLVLRFSTPRHASGTLYFEGEEDGYKFLAEAPVTVYR